MSNIINLDNNNDSNIFAANIASINPLKFDDFICECGSKVYTEKIITKKVPIYYTSAIGTDLMDFRFLVCDTCGELHEVFANNPTFKELLDK